MGRTHVLAFHPSRGFSRIRLFRQLKIVRRNKTSPAARIMETRLVVLLALISQISARYALEYFDGSGDIPMETDDEAESEWQLSQPITGGPISVENEPMIPM